MPGLNVKHTRDLKMNREKFIRFNFKTKMVLDKIHTDFDIF